MLRSTPQIWIGADECNCCRYKIVSADTYAQQHYYSLPCIVSLENASGKCVRCRILGLECVAGKVWKKKTVLVYPDGWTGRYVDREGNGRATEREEADGFATVSREV